MIFISYQRADTLFAAHALGYAIQHGGYEPFVDTGSIDGGELFRNVIDEAASRANLMFVLIGPTFDFSLLHRTTDVVAYEWRRAQFYAVPVVPALVDGGQIPSADMLPAELRWFTKRNAYQLRRATFSRDISSLVEAIPVLCAAPRRAARVLWVDDMPANNEVERKALRRYGIVFDNVVSTAEAVAQLANEDYDLVITDLGREHSSDFSQSAGADFLRHPVFTKGGPPVVVYASEWAEKRREELMRLGAIEVTAARQHLIASVVGILGRDPEEVKDLSR
jgi:CheY-like chemotaxis protein